MRHAAQIVLVGAMLVAGTAMARAHADDGSTTVQRASLEQLPAVVMSTLEREREGGTIHGVTKESWQDQTVYRAQITHKGQLTDDTGNDRKHEYIYVSEDGKVLLRASARKQLRGAAR
ncbi:MAG TPA: hypothetical protein VEH80_11145 [Candidatus Bathyarchaeia archaeon]|nr:hypothetical protein [Candidatus Bathyarchaeia archaeon]